MQPEIEHRLALTRRELFQQTGLGLGSIALASMLQDDAAADSSRSTDPLATKPTHFRPRAKNVIFLHMVGAPSQLDLFDYKPTLQKNDGKLVPDDLWKGLRLAFIRKQPKLLGTQFKFHKHAGGGVELSDQLPHLAEVADELTVIKSLHTEHFNHAPAQLFFQTGFGRFGRPTFGSWVNYGLGSENKSLPGFVVLITGAIAGAGNSLWGNGFLPSLYQGIEFRSTGDPVLFLSNPDGITPQDRRRIVDRINVLNAEQLAHAGDPEIATRIAQYEMAYRMQTAVPELMNTSDEPKHIHEMYGTKPGSASFANNCLLARRLVERGVRFVQLFDSGWDHHGGVFNNIKKKTATVDQPAAALIKDLKQRGLLDETLVVWGAEFGRTPMLQGSETKNAGRDHHKDAFCAWIGGVKGGFTYGKTDDLGFHAVEDRMHVNDFHATLLHLLGLDHEQLTYKFQGRNFRLSDVGGQVAHQIIA
ncbi:MAG: DUF1501 domain-containing protein [Planctomycetota bacterium]|nr:DUF1501 domain-containing protein [Planctomycetota bacterium]